MLEDHGCVTHRGGAFLESPREFMDNQNVPCLSSCTGPAYLPNETRTSSSGEPVDSSDIKPSGGMAGADIKPKCMERAKKWSDEVENLYRFQQAGYRDEIEYKQVKHVDMLLCMAFWIKLTF
ncbi:meiosis expressed gene 1 protein homolog isoform X3 [Alligator sinensis]|uniref:Meiosis expressed gene 1 protein homolog isoform X3 n=1 Tax=Alligator sinensis TaxID=38654 RepID=A0A3Q0GEF4_ALLSI|nr:meiosis expressed gene 1 protein homolog isoform X3 [Alligator sinensis]